VEDVPAGRVIQAAAQRVFASGRGGEADACSGNLSGAGNGSSIMQRIRKRNTTF
jgi:hypothetical protein